MVWGDVNNTTVILLYHFQSYHVTKKNFKVAKNLLSTTKELDNSLAQLISMLQYHKLYIQLRIYSALRYSVVTCIREGWFHWHMITIIIIIRCLWRNQKNYWHLRVVPPITHLSKRGQLFITSYTSLQLQ